MKKILFTTTTLASVIAPAVAVVSCGSKDNFDPSKKDSAIMLVGMSGHDDKGFLQGAYDGTQKAINDIGGFKKYSEVKVPGAGIPDSKNGTNKALQAGTYMVIGVGYQYATFFNTKEYAGKYKDRQFIAIDGPVVDSNFVPLKKLNDNVIAIDFKAEQAAFQAGVATGIYLAKNKAIYSSDGLKVGAFGGAPYAPIKGMIYGFMKGIAYYNDNLAKDDSKVEFIGWNGKKNGFTGGFVADVTSRTKANTLISRKADVIFPVAGGQVSSVVDAIKAISGSKTKIIGVDSDQNIAFGADGEHFITSAMKDTKNAVYKAIKTIYGATDLGLTKGTNNFVGLTGGYVKLGEGKINKIEWKGTDLLDSLKSDQTSIKTGDETLYTQLSKPANQIYKDALLVKADWKKVEDAFNGTGSKELTLADFT